MNDNNNSIMQPADSLGFIGRNPGKNNDIYIATGDSGNGITHGTIAGIILSDLILQKKNYWADIYDLGRKISESLMRQSEGK